LTTSEVPPEARKFFNASKEQYVQKWVSDSVLLSRHGFYDIFSDSIELSDSGLHVDFGSGVGSFLLSLHKKRMREHKNVHLIGVDNLEQMQILALDYLTSNGANAHVIGMVADSFVRANKGMVYKEDFHFDADTFQRRKW